MAGLFFWNIQRGGASVFSGMLFGCGRQSPQGLSLAFRTDKEETMTFQWKQVVAPAFAAFLLLGAAACDDGGAPQGQPPQDQGQQGLTPPSGGSGGGAGGGTGGGSGGG